MKTSVMYDGQAAIMEREIKNSTKCKKKLRNVITAIQGAGLKGGGVNIVICRAYYENVMGRLDVEKVG
jgi:hypothetical protein